MKYLEQMQSDILDYIKENEIEVTAENRDEVSDRLYEDLWTVDSVTGNGSGSYTFNSHQAMEYVLDDGQEYMEELIEEFCIEPETIAHHIFDWEYWDVSIRCYLLGRAIEAALDELV